MLMALMICVFLCPNEASAFQCHDDTLLPTACQDFSDNHHSCDNEDFCGVPCVYELRDDADLSVFLPLVQWHWIYNTQLFAEKAEHINLWHLRKLAYSNSHSFAIRHLSTIILRV